MITDAATVLSYKGKDRAERVLKSHNGKVSLRRGGRTYTRSVRTLMELAFWQPPARAQEHPCDENRMPSGRCRICHAKAMARYRAKKRATATQRG